MAAASSSLSTVSLASMNTAMTVPLPTMDTAETVPLASMDTAETVHLATVHTAETVPLVAITPSRTAETIVKTAGSGPFSPTFTNQDYQTPTTSELLATKSGVISSPGKLDLIIYWNLEDVHSTLINTNSVGKKKLCYAPRTIVGIDMRCVKCSKHFMTHDPN